MANSGLSISSLSLAFTSSRTLEDDYDEETDVEEEQTSISEEDEAILKEGGVIGIIEIPGLNIRYPVMEGTASKVLNAGIGHIEETAGIGESGNCVLMLLSYGFTISVSVTS